jgi:hypothetical protein
MKRNYLILTIFLLGINTLSAQNYHPFPDTNATWCDIRYDDGWPVPNYYYFFYKTNGKANINDTLYTVISDQDNLTSCYLREENKKVFCKLGSDSQEFVLYDFGLQVGDTMALFDLHGGMFWNGVVDQVDSVLIGLKFHKRFHIECPEWHSCLFIEGIGADLGFMYCDVPWVDVYGNLLCFSQDDTIYETGGSGAFTPGNCWLYIGLEENSTGEIVVYPNPASEFIYLTGYEKSRLELTNLPGMIIRQSGLNSMFVGDLKEGVYLLQVFSEKDELLKQVKVLKVN